MIKSKRPLVVFDLETTGLDVSQDRIIEIGILKTDETGNLVDSFESLITYISHELNAIYWVFLLEVATRPGTKIIGGKKCSGQSRTHLLCAQCLRLPKR
jgi:oligoribonuclease (3'-5' exoribonuclease)